MRPRQNKSLGQLAPRQYNKTLYLPSEEDVAIWHRAKTLFPFELEMSVSQFCNTKVKEEVKRLEEERNRK